MISPLDNIAICFTPKVGSIIEDIRSSHVLRWWQLPANVCFLPRGAPSSHTHETQFRLTCYYFQQNGAPEARPYAYDDLAALYCFHWPAPERERISLKINMSIRWKFWLHFSLYARARAHPKIDKHRAKDRQQTQNHLSAASPWCCCAHHLSGMTLCAH